MSTLSTDRLRAIAIACLVEPGTPGVAELIAERGHEEALRLCAALPATGRVGQAGWIPRTCRACSPRCRGWGCASCSPARPSSPASCSTSPNHRWPCGSGDRWTSGRPP